jgi:hypothetical protein
MDFNGIIQVFNKRGFKARAFDSIEQVKEVLQEEIAPGQSVGVGGSMTVKQSGITDMLRARGNTVHFHWEVDKSEINRVRKLASQADVYLSSSNAVTADGKLVNIDGYGNRVASMFYGPDRVYVICGRNKVVENEDKAVERIKTKACPQNAERLNRNTPCRKTGRCHDCFSDDRMCSVKVVIERCPKSKEINIMFVDEELGY